MDESSVLADNPEHAAAQLISVMEKVPVVEDGLLWVDVEEHLRSSLFDFV